MQAFGPTISGLIHRHIGPERLCLWDSKKRGGRPDVMKLVKEAYIDWGAEGVLKFSTSVDYLMTWSIHDQWSSSHPMPKAIQKSCKAAKKQ